MKQLELKVGDVWFVSCQACGKMRRLHENTIAKKRKSKKPVRCSECISMSRETPTVQLLVLLLVHHRHGGLSAEEASAVLGRSRTSVQSAVGRLRAHGYLWRPGRARVNLFGPGVYLPTKKAHQWLSHGGRLLVQSDEWKHSEKRVSA